MLLSKLLLGSKLLLWGKLLLLLRNKLLLRCLPLLSLSEELVELSLSQLRGRGRLSSRGGGNRLGSAKLGATALGRECLLSLLELLGLLGSKLLLGNSWLKMSWERVNLTITIFVSGKSFKSNLFSGQLRNRGQSRLLGLRSKLLLLLGSKLLGEGRLLLSWGKLLGVLGKLLVLRKLSIKSARLLSKLLLRLLGKLLLRGKLLRLLSKLLWLLSKLLSWLLGKLLWLLLSLLELLEVLVKVLCIELFRSRTARVEVGSIENWASWRLTTLVGKSLTLGSIVSLTSNQLLSFNNRLLVSNHSSMTLLLKGECRVNRSRSSISCITADSNGKSSSWKLQVRGESSAIVC